MRFILHLVDSGQITPEQAVEGLREHFESTPPLGKLALFSGKMTVRQVVHVLDLQVERPQERFGELAVAEGFMTEDDVQELLKRQNSMRRSVEQVLTEQGAISPEALELQKNRWRLQAG